MPGTARLDKEFQQFVGGLARLDLDRAIRGLARYFAMNLNRWREPADRPWDLTPPNLLNLSRFILRHARSGAGRFEPADLTALLKQYHSLKDDRNATLLRSSAIENKFELSLRQEYVRSFYGVRTDHYLARFYRLLQLLDKRSPLQATLFGLPFADLFLLPYGIAELVRSGKVELTPERLRPFLPPASFDEFAAALSLTKAEFDRRFDAGYDPEYFETAYNPLLEFPCIRLADGGLVPVAPQYLFLRIADLFYDALQKREGGDFVGAFNTIVPTYVERLLAQLAPRATVRTLDDPSDPGSRFTLLVEDRPGVTILLQIVPNRVQNIYATTCNVFNIYDRTASVIAPSVLGLMERIERMGGARKSLRDEKILSVIVTFQPLYMRNVTYFEKCVTKILTENYEVPEAKLPRTWILGMGEFELALASLPHFGGLTDLLERKRDRDCRALTFGEFLAVRLGSKLREAPSVVDVETEMSTRVKRLLKGADRP